MKKLLFFIIMILIKIEPAQIFDHSAPDGGKQEKENQSPSIDKETHYKYKFIKQSILKNCSPEDSTKILKIIQEYENHDLIYEQYIKDKKGGVYISQEEWDKNNQELIEVAKNNNESRLKKLLESKEVNVDFQDDEGYSALIHSIKRGHINIAKLLIEYQANVNAQDYEYGYTCLMHAVLKSNLRMVKFLLDNGARVNDLNYAGASTLYLACLPPYCNKDIIKVLLDHCAEINEYVLKISSHEILNLLSSYKEYLYKKKLINNHLNKEITNLVMEYDISYEQLERNTEELIKAVENNNVSKVKELLESGEVYINAQNQQGWTPLMIAGSMPSCIEITRLLLEHKANVNFSTKEGITALSIAAWSSNYNHEIVNLLLDNGAEINFKSNDDSTPLMDALKKGNLDIVKLLIIRGANIHVIDSIGNTILMNVIFPYNWSQVSEIIELLLDNNISVNVQNNCGITALMFAANKSLEMVKLLIAKGAKPDLKNKFGNTALDYAKNQFKEDIVKYLQALVSISSSSSSSYSYIHW